MYTCTYSYVCTDCYPARLSATSYRKHPAIQCQDDPATRGEERAPRRVRVTPQRGGYAAGARAGTPQRGGESGIALSCAGRVRLSIGTMC